MKRKEYLTRRAKVQDFFIGFGGFILLNLVMWGGGYFLIEPWSQLAETIRTLYPNVWQVTEPLMIAISLLFSLLPWVVNLAGLILCGYYRPWITIGAVAVLGILLALPTLALTCFWVSCLTIIITASVASIFLPFFQ
ncbi:MAG: hypothetical protein SVX38_14385 [Chloroflexota bacterium]|nr:hypothetical protein [Chloroflexota bacterium]